MEEMNDKRSAPQQSSGESSRKNRQGAYRARRRPQTNKKQPEAAPVLAAETAQAAAKTAAQAALPSH